MGSDKDQCFNFEEALCKSYSSCVTQEDEKFLSEVFAQLTDEATDDDKRCELVSQ